MKQINFSGKRFSLLPGTLWFCLPAFLLFSQLAFAGYTVSISPTTVPVAVPTALTLTITSGVNNLGSIEVTIPAGVTGPATTGDVVLTPPFGKAWTVISVSPTLIQLVANGAGNVNRLGIGESLGITFTVTLADGSPKQFTTNAYTTQNFTGSGTGPILGTQPTLNDNGCSAAGSTLDVDNAVSVSGNGSTWTCALKELSDAVAIAEFTPSVTSIWVAAGTYKPTTGTDRNVSITITRNNLKVLGGFVSGATLESSADPSANPTIISGDIGAGGDATDNSYHNVFIRDVPVGAPVIVDGFRIMHGNANGSGFSTGAGGAVVIYNTMNAVTLSRDWFMSNSSSTYGGAVLSYRANPVIMNSYFSANSSASGGGMYGYFSTPTISRTVFSGNSATFGGGYYGNFNNGNVPSINFESCVFSGNTATNEGGAVYLNQITLAFVNTVFNANSSTWSGAVHLLNSSQAAFGNSTFFANSASNSLGAGGVFLGYNNCQVGLANSIFWKNTVAGADNVANADIKNTYNTVNVVAYTMLQANSTMGAGIGNDVGVDPLFMDESNPIGADAMWRTSDDGLQLTSSSPALNSGSNAAVIGYTTDIIGNARISCVTVDKGAYEYQGCIDAPAKSTISQQSKKELGTAVSGIVANPFGSTLQVRYAGSEKATLRVIDVSGKPTYNNPSISQGVTQVDAAGWGKGMYQVVITTVSGKQMLFKALKL